LKVGLDQNSLNHLPGLKGIQILELARSLGLEGVQFLDICEVSPRIDRRQLQEVYAHAKQHGMYLEVGLLCINPHQPHKKLLEDGGGDLLKGLRRHLEMIAEVSLGSRSVRCYIGGPGDRLRGRIPWRQQIDDTITVAKGVAPLLRDLSLKLAIENHADLSTYELLEIVSKIGSDVAGICLDTGNTMVAMEEPLAATKRAAPFTVATHLKDAIIVFGDDGLVLSPRSVGQGVLPVAEIIQVLNSANPNIALSIEDYGMLLSVELFNDEYVSSFAEVSPNELAHLVRLARASEQSISEGIVASPLAVERIPWSVRAKERLDASARFVNVVIDQLNFRSQPNDRRQFGSAA
jgi:sugar phosphate isomerase/epimerase